jgi:ubiquinone/menaquinone biosynthesis C-methylase UbiE
MSSYVFMKILESAPRRYDRGIRMLSCGRIDEIYRRVAREVAAPDRRILDVGCGTGGLSLACAERGAAVVGIDVNAGMLEVARSKTVRAGSTGSVEWIELGAVEIEDRFPEAVFDAVVSCLVFSELEPDEQSYVLRSVQQRLKPGGKLVIADEVLSATFSSRLWHRLWRWPLALTTYALTQATTHPVRHLAERVRGAGFAEVKETRLSFGTFAIVSAKRKEVPS